MKKRCMRIQSIIFKDLDIKVDPRKKVADLPIAERQMIEIAKAVSYKSKVISYG